MRSRIRSVWFCGPVAPSLRAAEQAGVRPKRARGPHWRGADSTHEAVRSSLRSRPCLSRCADVNHVRGDVVFPGQRSVRVRSARTGTRSFIDAQPVRVDAFRRRQPVQVLDVCTGTSSCAGNELEHAGNDFRSRHPSRGHTHPLRWTGPRLLNPQPRPRQLLKIVHADVMGTAWSWVSGVQAGTSKQPPIHHQYFAVPGRAGRSAMPV
mmetsp:Transcript_20251/g.77737  ORF Transcript_20251/g.77737 Transcript_20251/m.77737 type:complete len:208 (+) Transcript_20251:910-1533(+)